MYPRRRTDAAIGRAAAALLLVQNFGRYSDEHVRDHHALHHMTLRDPTVQAFLISLGMRPGMTPSQMWHRLLGTLLSPRFHAAFAVGRLRSLAHGSDRSDRVMAAAIYGAIIAATALTGQWLILLAGPRRDNRAPGVGRGRGPGHEAVVVRHAGVPGQLPWLGTRPDHPVCAAVRACPPAPDPGGCPGRPAGRTAVALAGGPARTTHRGQRGAVDGALRRGSHRGPARAGRVRGPARAVPDATLRWDWKKVDRPAGGLRFTGSEEYLDWIRGRLREDYVHSKLGPAGSAVKATAAMLRDLRDEVRQVISHQGISGTSYREHVDRWFSGLTNFFASGPPASRIEELSALVEAGVVRFVGPRMQVTADEGSGAFLTRSPAVDGHVVRAPLIEAHLPLTDLRRTTDPLLCYLLGRGQCRPHAIPNADGSSTLTGGLDITQGAQHVIDAEGRPHRGRFSYGPPVESVQWVTAIGARPHVNSRTLLQADAIARAALGTAAENLAASSAAVESPASSFEFCTY